MPPNPHPEAESNLRAAERVVSLLAEHGVPAVVIGAVALAAHRYVRHNEDIDLGAKQLRTLTLTGCDLSEKRWKS